MNARFALIATAALVFSITFMVNGFIDVTRRINSFGELHLIGVEAYWDQNCTDIVRWVDWGIIEPGDNSTVSFYVKNKGTNNATLSINASNWEPLNASRYLTLSWNYSGAVLQPEQLVPVTLILNVNINVTGFEFFSFDIWIFAHETLVRAYASEET